MAQFPNAVVSFATKNPGDTIPSADWNSQNAEIVAIEDGYLNGTARLNSSNSTVANLSVTGNSTFAGSVTVSSNLTVSGSLILSTALANNAQPRCRAFHGSTQTLQGNSSETALTFNSEDFNIGTVHSTGTNPTRFTIQSTGVWLFGATVRIAALPAGNVAGMRFMKNGTSVMGSYTFGAWSGGGGQPVAVTHTLIDQVTSTGDFVEVMVRQNTAGNLECGNASSRVDQNQFWAVKLW